MNSRNTIFHILVNSTSYWQIPIYVPRLVTRQLSFMKLLPMCYLPRVVTRQNAASNFLPRLVTRQVKWCKNKIFEQFLHCQNAIL